MNWLDIIGPLGGAAGIVAFIKAGIDVYMAKSGKTKVDVANMQDMLTEAHKMYDAVTARYIKLEKAFDDYKVEVEKREEKRDKEIGEVSRTVNKLERTVTQAYRCRYPENIQDCPVVKSYEEKLLCEDCAAK